MDIFATNPYRTAFAGTLLVYLVSLSIFAFRDRLHDQPRPEIRVVRAIPMAQWERENGCVFPGHYTHSHEDATVDVEEKYDDE